MSAIEDAIECLREADSMLTDGASTESIRKEWGEGSEVAKWAGKCRAVTAALAEDCICMDDLGAAVEVALEITREAASENDLEILSLEGERRDEIAEEHGEAVCRAVLVILAAEYCKAIGRC